MYLFFFSRLFLEYQGFDIIIVIVHSLSRRLSSNIFGVFIGLGIPWLLLIVSNNGAKYDELHDDGLVFAVLVLILLSVAFAILAVTSKFVLKKWMSIFFLSVYVIYLFYGVFSGILVNS